MMSVLSRSHPPDVVVYARTTDHVSQIVKYCASKHLPVIPFGTGTGLEGGVTAPQVRHCSSSDPS